LLCSSGGVINTSQEFADDLGALRQACRKSYRTLARETGLGFTTIAGYCTGRHLPQLSVDRQFSLLLTAMGVPPGKDHDEWIARLVGVRARSARITEPSRNPYLGLRTFEPSDADVYFGRSDLSAQLVEAVRRAGDGQTPLVVVGASGSGKSSLLRAGLLPAFPSSVLFTPGATPMREWLRAANEADEADEADEDTLIVIDQFEELFTLCQNEDVRTTFVDSILARPGTLVLGLRADFYDRALEYPKLAVLLQRHQLVVEPMDERQLREIIIGPAHTAGLALQDGLVDLLLRDTEREPGVLPLLSHTLRTIVELAQHEDSDGETIHIEQYRVAGGVQGAVARTADGAYRALSAEHRAIARNLFLRLVATDENTADTRRRVMFDELFDGRGSTESDVLAEVLDVFVTRRLLTTGTDTVEISHESLILAWPLLQGWLAEDRIGHHVHGRLTAAARIWRDEERSPEFLYHGGLLATALDWAAEPGPQDALNPLEQTFLDASVAARTARLNVDRRRIRRRYQTISAVVVLLVAAAGTGCYARQVAKDADREARIAFSREIAGKAVRLWERDTALAGQLALSAYQTSPTPEALGALLDSSARPMPRRLRTDAVTVSATRSLLAAGTAEGTIKLYRTISGAPTPTGTVLRLGGQIDAVLLSADESLLAAGTRDGQVAAWRITDITHPVALNLVPGSPSRVFGLAFTADRSLLAAGSADGTTRLWRLDRETPPTVLKGSARAVKSIAFTPNGTTLAAGGDDGTVRLWDVSVADRPATLPILTGPTSRIFTIAISPDGHTLAAGTAAEHVVYSWNIADPTHPSLSGAPLSGPASWINSLTFSPDNTTLAAGSSDTKLWRWDLRTRQPIGTLPHPAPIVTAVYQDSNTMTTTATDGITRIWPLPGPMLIGSTNQVFSATYNTVGDRLLVGAGDQTLRLWDLTDPAAPTNPYPPLTNTAPLSPLVGSSALSPDGRIAVGGAADGAITVWNVGDPAHPARLGAPLPAGTTTIQSIVFSPDGRTLAVSCDDGTARVVNISDPSHPTVTSEVRVGLNAYGVRFSPSGDLLAIASGDGNGTLWDVTDHAHPRLIHTEKGFTGPVYSVAFSSDGNILAFGGADFTVRLIDLSRPDKPTLVDQKLIGPVGEIYDLGFQPGTDVLAIASIDQTIWLWNVRTPAKPTLLAILNAAEGGLFTLTFSPNGRTLVAGGRDIAVRLWNTDTDTVARSVCTTVGDPISRSEWDQFIAGKPYTPPC
jgi:WD40 repeat protein